MKKTAIVTESREYEFSAAEVKKIIIEHLEEEHMIYMGKSTEFYIDPQGGDVTITTQDKVDKRGILK